MPDNVKKSVFISYKSEDYLQARWVRDTLETNGISCWMAPESIPGGSDYAKEIPSAIENCTCFVVVISKKTQTSKWVPKELGEAINKNKVVMPFLLEHCDLNSDYNFYLSNVQRYNAYINKSETIQRMIFEIRAILQFNNDTPIVIQKKKRRRGLLAVIFIMCAVLIATGVFVASLYFNKDKPPADATLYYFNLRETNTMIDEEYVPAAQRAKERIKALCGDNGYIINDLKDKDRNGFTAAIPDTAFRGYDPQTVMEGYVATSGRLALIKTPEEDETIDEDYPSVEINRADIEKIELFYGKISDLDSTLFEDPENYPYLIITFTDDFVDGKLPTLDDCEELSFYIEDNPCYLFAQRTKDDNVFYLAEPETGGVFTEVLLCILQQEDCEHALNVKTDLESVAEWETVEEISSAGKLQCNSADIADDVMLFQYRVFEDLSTSEMEAFEQALKARLDTVGNPYAIGKQKESGKTTYYTVKTTAERMNSTARRLLGCYNNVTIGYGLNKYSLNITYDDTVRVTEDGLEISFGQFSTEDYNALTSNIPDGQEVFLYNDTATYELRLMRGIYHKNESSILFTDYALLDATEFTDVNNNNIWLARLIKQVLTDEAVFGGVIYSDDSPQLGSIQYGTETFEADVALTNEELLSAVDEKYDISYRKWKDNTLVLWVSCPVDENFSSRAPEIAKDIYSLVAFEKLGADTLVIYFTEASEGDDSAYIAFSKWFCYHYYYVADGVKTTGDPIIEGCGSFKGEWTNQYGQALLDSIAADPFYQERTVEGYSYWVTK